jgi:hypothetical protein
MWVNLELTRLARCGADWTNRLWIVFRVSVVGEE